jgi:hypothetical protein
MLYNRFDFPNEQTRDVHGSGNDHAKDNPGGGYFSLRVRAV